MSNKRSAVHLSDLRERYEAFCADFGDHQTQSLTDKQVRLWLDGLGHADFRLGIARHLPWSGRSTVFSSPKFRGYQECSYGDALPAEERQEGTIPVFGSNGEVGKHSKGNIGGETIVVGRKGSFGKINFSFGPVFSIDTTYFVDHRCSTAFLRWLYYCLQTARLDIMFQQ